VNATTSVLPHVVAVPGDIRAACEALRADLLADDGVSAGMRRAALYEFLTKRTLDALEKDEKVIFHGLQGLGLRRAQGIASWLGEHAGNAGVGSYWRMIELQLVTAEIVAAG
jgi:hypothetical protein